MKRPILEKLENSNVIYKIPCLDFSKTYVGQTRRMLSVRCEEHKNSTRSTVTANQILKRVAMKNGIHYSKQNTAKAFRVIAALV